jgi:hypothetical protein
MNTIRAYASADAHVIYGTAYDDGLGDEHARYRRGHRPVTPGPAPHGARRCTVLRTGTDNVHRSTMPDGQQCGRWPRRHPDQQWLPRPP